MSKPNCTVRFAAMQIVFSMSSGHASLATLLPHWSDRIDAREKALLMEMSYGVARWSFKLQALMAQLMDKPLRKKDRDVAALIQLGLYQLIYMRIPEHATLNTTVAVSKEMGKPWAKGLVNAVLRNYLRNKEGLDKLLEAPPPTNRAVSEFARYAFPQWLGEQLKRDWPDQWTQMLEQANLRPPMALRVNLLQQSRAQYQEQLLVAGLKAKPSTICNSGLLLDDPVTVDALPGFYAGLVSVQDAAAQIAVELLAPRPGEHILDGCAAPGGKTCHLLEHAKLASDSTLPSSPLATCSVLALDNDEDRLQRVGDNAQRLGLSETLELRCADAADIDVWWDGTLFDAVLLDAPCSGTGVLRRHPDIKLLRRPTDIPELLRQQQSLLRSLWRVLKPGGRLLYATCSQLKAENELQIARFLEDRPDAKPCLPAQLHWGNDRGCGRQILADTIAADGFFYALLRKGS